MIKDESLLAARTVTGNEEIFVILRTNQAHDDRETKLSDVLNELPSGLVIKEETGIGATYLELLSKRNSIIVEPIKVTASTKANNHNAMYFGSPTKLHPRVSESRIRSYLDDDSVPHKKLIVVADSLNRLIEIIGEKALTNYFLLIDEIDSFQLDSSFRMSMERCLDLYKSFPTNNRAMVSATVLEFSDPELAKERRTIIKYDKPTSRKLNLIFTSGQINPVVAKTITNLLQKHPEEKVMIAFNAVKGCVELANHLVKHEITAKDDISILCSAQSEKRAGIYYKELDNDSLPSRVNFVTSAYFTGFDLNERYHLISVSDNRSNIRSLSDKRLKQIAGRCRSKMGLLSEFIIYNLGVQEEDSYYTFDYLLKTAEKEITALKCIESNYENHPLLKASTEEIRKQIIRHTSIFGYKLVRDKEGKAVISYLNLDACLEAVRVRKELYSDKSLLPQVLREANHQLSMQTINVETEIEKDDYDVKDRTEQVQILLSVLRKMHSKETPKSLITKSSKWTAMQKQIIKKLSELNEYIDSERLYQLIEESGSKRDSRELNNIFSSAYFLALPPTSHFKRQVNYHIPIGHSFTGEELVKKWNDIFAEGFLLTTISKPVQAIRFTKLHYKTTKRKGDQKPHYIIGDNPYKLKLIKHMELNDKTPAGVERIKAGYSPIFTKVRSLSWKK
jgi:hypothetical protein